MYKDYLNIKTDKFKFNRRLAEFEKKISEQNNKISQKDETIKKLVSQVSQVKNLRDTLKERSSFANHITFDDSDDLELEVNPFLKFK